MLVAVVVDLIAQLLRQKLVVLEVLVVEVLVETVLAQISQEPQVEQIPEVAVVAVLILPHLQEQAVTAAPVS